MARWLSIVDDVTSDHMLLHHRILKRFFCGVGVGRGGGESRGGRGGGRGRGVAGRGSEGWVLHVDYKRHGVRRL